MTIPPLLRYITAGGLYYIGVVMLAGLMRTLNDIRNGLRASRDTEHVPHKLS